MSLVDSPANQKAHAVLAKRNGDTPIVTPKPSFLAKFADRFLKAVTGTNGAGLTPEAVRTLAKDAMTFDEVANKSKVWPMLDALSTSLYSLLCERDDDDPLTPAERGAMVKQSLAEFEDAVMQLDGITKNNPDAPGASGADADDNAAATLSTKEDGMKPEEIAALIKSVVTEAVGAAVAEVQKSNATVLEGQAKTIDTLTKAVTELTAEKKRSGLRKRVDVLVKAGAPIATDDAVEMLEKLDANGQDKLLAFMGKAAETAEVGAIFSQFSARKGATAGPSTSPLALVGGADAATAEALLNKRAGELMASNTKLTKEQAIDQALQENPDAYEVVTSDDEGEG